MSMQNFESAFRGSSKNAAATVDSIQQSMRLFAAKGCAKALHFSHNVLAQMCKAMAAGGTNYSLYCDVLLNVLGPNIEPAKSPTNWSPFLEMVRYFYFLLCERLIYTEMSKVYDWLATKSHKLQNERDYEFILGIYTQHLLTQNIALDTCPVFSKSVEKTCIHLATLFKEMLQKNKELNFVYWDLIKNITRFLIPSKAHKYIAYAPNSAHMFDALFELIAGIGAPQIAVDATKSLFMDYMVALIKFKGIDAVKQWSGDQVALRFLRASRDLAVFKSNKAMTYALSLLYYFVKFVFCQDAVDIFSKSYAELCENFRKFFAQNGDLLKTEQWFMEFIMVMSLMLSQMDVSKLKVFDATTKLKQNGVHDVNNAHLALILDLMKLAKSITQSRLMKWTCCTSTRKHTSLSLTQAALKFYTFFVATAAEDESTTAADKEIQTTLTTIMRHSVQVIDSMVCMNSSSPDLQSFNYNFNYLIAKVKTSSQANLCIELTKMLLKLQTKFTPQMWIELLLRLRRASHLTKDSKIIAELHAMKIGYMLKLKHLDYSMIMNDIGVFYTTEHLLIWDMCLLDVLETSNNPLKPVLNVQEKRLLHTLESQFVSKYQKANFLLFTSLLKCSQTHLDYVLVVRESKQLETHGKVQRIYNALKRKANETSGLKRIEKLTLAHACIILADEQIGKMRKIFDCQKDLTEENLERYLLNVKIKQINVITEIQLIEIMLDSLQLFEDFFKTADLEPITSQELLLDWEAILTDISLLARWLQLRGYLEHACKGWLLLYNIADYLNDSNNVLRALAFLCEHSAYVDHSSDINLTKEVNQKLPIILYSLHNIHTLVPRRQNYLLLSLCQLAYFYARQNNFNYAYMLLNLVELKRNELPERRDKFDFILASLHVVKFRIRWKLVDSTEAASTDSTCILRQIEATLNSFRGFVYISSEDCINYAILLFGMMQEYSECSVNRLCDSNVKSFLIYLLRAALEYGAALRIVQSLAAWALVNLQTENVDRAQVKLQFIECFLGLRNVKKLLETKSASCAAQAKMEEPQKIEHFKEQQLSQQVNSGVEIMRRVAEVHLSPIMKDKLRLSSNSNEQRDLQSFLKHDFNEAINKNSFLQWTFIMVGCINARLLFLINEYAQLDQFYKNSKNWCQNQKNYFLLTNFQNVQLMSMQHYLNYLRTNKQYDSALEYVEEALNSVGKSARNVDKVYYINLELQKRATKFQMLHSEKNGSSDKLRRALEFGNSSPEERKTIGEILSSTRKITEPKIVIQNNENGKSPSSASVADVAKRITRQEATTKINDPNVKKDKFRAHDNALMCNTSEESDATTNAVCKKIKNIGADVIISTNNLGRGAKVVPTTDTRKKNASKTKQNISLEKVDITESDEDLTSTFSNLGITVIEVKSRGSSRSTTLDSVKKVDAKLTNAGGIKPQQSTKSGQSLITPSNLLKLKDADGIGEHAIHIQPINQVNPVDTSNKENEDPTIEIKTANEKQQQSTKSGHSLIKPSNLPNLKDARDIGEYSQYPTNSNKNQQHDALHSQPINQINPVDTSNKENEDPTIKAKTTNEKPIKPKIKINNATSNKDQQRNLPPIVSIPFTSEMAECCQIIDSCPIVSEVASKLKSLELSINSLSTRITEKSLETKLNMNPTLQTVPTKCAKSQMSKAADTIVKKRGRPKKTETEPIKDNNAIETVKITRRRQQT